MLLDDDIIQACSRTILTGVVRLYGLVLYHHPTLSSGPAHQANLALGQLGDHNFLGGGIVKNGVQYNDASGFICTPTCDILVTLVTSEVNKNVSNKFIGGKKGVWREVVQTCPFL